MSAYGKNFSTRLFIQAAFTGLLAPVGSHGSTWLMVTFLLAAGAVAVGALAHRGHERTRELVIGYEAAAVAVGVVGLMGHHYIPGTIVGVAALITAVSHPMPGAVAPMTADPAVVPAPQFAEPAPMPAQPMYAAPVAEPQPMHAAPVAEPQPVYAAPVLPEPTPAAEAAPVAEPGPVTEVAPVAEVTPVEQPPAPTVSGYTGVRAMTILPGR